MQLKMEEQACQKAFIQAKTLKKLLSGLLKKNKIIVHEAAAEIAAVFLVPKPHEKSFTKYSKKSH